MHTTPKRYVERLRATYSARIGGLRDAQLRALVESARRYYCAGHSDSEIRRRTRADLVEFGFSWLAIQILLALLPYLIDLFEADAATIETALGPVDVVKLPPLPPSSEPLIMSGWKTYVAAGALAAYAVFAFVSGTIEQAAMIELLLQAAALAGLRHAVATKSLAR
jgi:hypothetical protein